jgi:hypothetical protein
LGKFPALWYFDVFQVKCWLCEGFQKLLFPYDQLQEYWATILQDIPSHPLTTTPQKWKRSVPLVLWGDEGTVSNRTWMLATWKHDYYQFLCATLATCLFWGYLGKGGWGVVLQWPSPGCRIYVFAATTANRPGI